GHGVTAELSPSAAATPVEPPAANIPDPERELDAYRGKAPADAGARPAARLTALTIRKPNNQEFVRVRPGDKTMILSAFEVKNAKRLYLLKEGAESYLPEGSGTVRKYRFVLARSLRAVAPFLWPIPVPQDDLGYTWHASADAIARQAETEWVRVVS